MIRTSIIAATPLVSLPANGATLLFPEFAISYIRANHPEFAHHPIMVTCRGAHRMMRHRR